MQMSFCGGSGQGELAKRAHQKALERALGINDPSCSMRRLSHEAVAGMTRGEWMR